MNFYLHTSTLSLQKSSLFKEVVDKLESVYDTLNHIPVGSVFTPQDVVEAYQSLINQIGKENGQYAGFYSFNDLVQDVEFCTNRPHLYEDTPITKVAEYKYQ